MLRLQSLRGIGRGVTTGLRATSFAGPSRRGQATEPVSGDRRAAADDTESGSGGGGGGGGGGVAPPTGSGMDEQVRAVFHNPGGYRLPDETLDCEVG